LHYTVTILHIYTYPKETEYHTVLNCAVKGVTWQQTNQFFMLCCTAQQTMQYVTVSLRGNCVKGCFTLDGSQFLPMCLDHKIWRNFRQHFTSTSLFYGPGYVVYSVPKRPKQSMCVMPKYYIIK